MAIRGEGVPRTRWFGGVRAYAGKSGRPCSLGSLTTHVVPATEESYSETLGVVHGPITGDIALARLEPTQAERASERARARAARVDAMLASVGIRPRRRR